MSMKINKSSYITLIEEDIAWLEKMPRTLERDHIIAILKLSPVREYDDQRELSYHRCKLDRKIHWSKRSKDNNIYIYCDELVRKPKFNTGRVDGIFSGIYESDDNILYSFESDKITCSECDSHIARP